MSRNIRALERATSDETWVFSLFRFRPFWRRSLGAHVRLCTFRSGGPDENVSGRVSSFCETRSLRSRIDSHVVFRLKASVSMLFRALPGEKIKISWESLKSLRVCFQAFAAFFTLAHRSLCALAIAKRPALDIRCRFFGSVRMSRCFLPEPFKTSMAELMDPNCFSSFDASAFNARTMFTE